ncbi:hypothetical protein [Janthinobacterium aquaticum]|uniref:hypothetical protein n=1 Tax=Janthinobacterium sp. FT58W TaxID=2654254 RepID=UPI00186B17CC|nr:hypothetical protein [Janthinobacterium sp. FT58W]
MPKLVILFSADALIHASVFWRARARAFIVLPKMRCKRRPTAVYPWAPHDAMIEFGAQIDCVHKFIYGHNNSISYNQGETRAVSPSQR